MAKLLEASSAAGPVRVEDLWREIEALVPRAELRAAVATVGELVPFVDEDDEGEIRKRLAERIRVVSGFLRGSWRRLVYGHPAPADGTIDKNAYVFCVLTQFHRQLIRRDIYAPASSRWRALARSC